VARIILHIGLRKTGTTSIQKFLNSNYTTLLDHNILYPRSGLPVVGSIYAHHDLAASLTNIRPATKIQSWEDLLDEIDQHDDKVVLISSEIFSVATPQHIEQVRKNLAGHQVIVLIYLRDPASFMISLYKEQIKAHNGLLTFKKFSRKKSSLADYESLIKNWQLIFGDSNVILKNYDDLASGDQLIKNLLESLDLENCISKFSFIDKANISPKDEVVIMIRHLNFIKKKLPIPLFLRKKIQANIADLNSGNRHGKLLLKRYSRFLPKKIYTYKEMEWLENKILTYSSDYKGKFQNESKLTSFGNQIMPNSGTISS